MKAESIVEALALPNDSKVSHRIPKKMLLEQGAPTAADKRYINDGIEELNWIAALKPTNIGIAVYRDEIRDYLEIAVISATFRPEGKVSRLIELIHRAIPYPVVLVVSHKKDLSLSLAHKRLAQNEAGKTVIDGNIVTIDLSSGENLEKSFLDSLALAAQSAKNLFVLYQRWIERIEALAAARITGRLTLDSNPDAASTRKEVLSERAQLERELISLRAQASKEKQISRRVDLNLAIQKIENRLKERVAQL